MKPKIRDTQKIDFLTDKASRMSDKLKAVIRDSRIIDPEFKEKILKALPEIVGNQEIEWMKRNKAEIEQYLFNRYKFKIYPKDKILESFPIHLLVEPVSCCNLKCIMCFQSDKTFASDVKHGFMDIDFFKSIVDQAVKHGCKFLTLASRGEPTLHPDFKQMLRYCKGKFLELKINTNATLLNSALAEEILKSGVDLVVFSVDSSDKDQYESIRKGASFKKVMDNISMFAEMRNENPAYQKTAIRISGVFLKDGKTKQDKKAFLSFWKEIVDEVTYSDVITRWYSYDIEPLNCKTACNLLWQRLYIWHDGICNPCDFDYKSNLSVGSAKTNTITDIWTGEKFNKMRKLHLRGERKRYLPCDRCSLV